MNGNLENDIKRDDIVKEEVGSLIEETSPEESKTEEVPQVPKKRGRKKKTENVDSCKDEGVVLEPTPVDENEISPAEINSGVEKVDPSTLDHIKSTEEVLDEEDAGNIQIDMSTIEKDETGIPILTDEDIKRIKDSGLSSETFDVEIEMARETIKLNRDQLDIENQNFTEKKLRDSIKECEEKLKNPDLSEEDKTKYENEIKELNEAITYLPKYSKETEKELNEGIDSSIKLLATYQNVSRKDLGDLIKDGTLLALIAETSEGEFVRIITERENKNELEYLKKEHDKFDKKFEEIYKKYSTFVSCKNLLKSVCEIFNGENCIKNKIIISDSKTNLCEISDKKYNTFERISKREKLENNTDDVILKNFITNINISFNEKPIDDNTLLNYCKEISDKIRDIRLLNYYFNKIKEEFKNVDAISTIDINMPTSFSDFTSDEYCEKLLDFTNNGIVSSICDQLGQEIEESEKTLTETENKINDLYKDTKYIVEKEGFLLSFLKFTKSLSSNGITYTDYINLFTPEYIDNLSNSYFNIIKMISNSTNDKDFEIAATNLNITTMFINYYIHYLNGLKEGNIDEKWAMNFDPKSYIKNVYFEHKEEIDTLLDDIENVEEEIREKVILNCKNLSHAIVVLDYERSKFINSLEKRKSKGKSRFLSIKNSMYSNLITNIGSSIVSLLSRKYKEYKETHGYKESDVVDSREYLNYLKTEYKDQYVKEFNSFFGTIIHQGLGCQFVFALETIHENIMKIDGMDKNMASDCTKYLYHDLTLNIMGNKECPDDKKLSDYFKEKTKTINFSSLSFDMEKNVNMKESRYEVMKYILRMIYSVLSDISNSPIFTNQDEENNVEIKEVENKPKKLTKKEMEANRLKKLKEAKKKAKKEKESINFYTKITKEYNEVLSNPLYGTKVNTFNSADLHFCLEVDNASDTSAIIKVLVCRNYNKDNSMEFFKDAVVDKSKIFDSSVKKAYVGARTLPVADKRFKYLGEKKYFNYFEHKNPINKLVKEMSKSELIKYTVHFSYNVSKEFIYKSIMDYLNASGSMLDKDIKFKPNSRLNIKYFDGSEVNQSNLNFLGTNKWILLTYELNYDYVNKK